MGNRGTSIPSAKLKNLGGLLGDGMLCRGLPSMELVQLWETQDDSIPSITVRWISEYSAPPRLH